MILCQNAFNLMDKKKQNTEWLTDHQPDLIKIVGKHIKPNHKLSVEEIVSEINNHFLTKLIDKDFENQTEFHKFIYRVARNFIVWTAKGSKRKDVEYNSKKVDYTLEDREDGQITAFEHACNTLGTEDPNFAKLDVSDQYQNILKWLLDYSEILTPRQKNILPFVFQGRTLDELGNALGVSHQAISQSIIDMHERIKSHIKININEDFDKTVLIEGNRSINYLFGGERKKLRSKKV